MERIYNAKIKSTYLGVDEYGEMYLSLSFEYSEGIASTYKIKQHDANIILLIQEILNTLEIRSWEEMPRKFARIKVDEKEVIAVGNLINDESWVRLSGGKY